MARRRRLSCSRRRGGGAAAAGVVRGPVSAARRRFSGRRAGGRRARPGLSRAASCARGPCPDTQLQGCCAGYGRGSRRDSSSQLDLVYKKPPPPVVLQRKVHRNLELLGKVHGGKAASSPKRKNATKRRTDVCRRLCVRGRSSGLLFSERNRCCAGWSLAVVIVPRPESQQRSRIAK